MSLASQVLASIQTKIERFIKLYRILYRDFLFQDFIHKSDVKLMIEQLNTRITTVETNAATALSSAIASVNSMVTAHSHMVSTVGGPTAQAGSTTSVINTPVQLAAPQKAPLVPWTEAQHIARLNGLIALGPASAPFADGFDAQVLSGNIGIIADIGV
ncbi:MAG: hypothetical protein PHY47_00460 [Lachnospiraceae bacterium]|nr:hypothetical protein [Lachnospiraceae bacterium]